MDSNGKILYIRCILAVSEVLTPIMRKYLEDSEVDYADLKQDIFCTKFFVKTLFESEKTKVQRLHRSTKFGDFDVSLMFKIMRAFFYNFYVKKHLPTKRKWNSDPEESEKTIGDDINRIKRGRDKLFHNASGILLEPAYRNFFSECRKIATRADRLWNERNICSFQQRLKNCQKCDIQKEVNNGLKELMLESQKIKAYVDERLLECIVSIRKDWKRKECSNTKCKAIFGDIKNAENAVQKLQSKMEYLNKVLKSIKIEKVYHGSLVFNIVVENSVFKDDSALSEDIELFVKSVAMYTDLQFTSDEEKYVVVTVDEDSHNFEWHPYNEVSDDMGRIDEDEILYLTLEEEEVDIDECLSNNVDLINDMASTANAKAPGSKGEIPVMVVIQSYGSQHERTAGWDWPDVETLYSKHETKARSENNPRETSKSSIHEGKGKFNRKRRLESQTGGPGIALSPKKRKIIQATRPKTRQQKSEMKEERIVVFV